MRSRPKIKKRIKQKHSSNSTKRIVFFALSLFVIIISYILISYFCIPKITLEIKGKKLGSSIVLNYKEKYNAPKYYAKYRGQDVTEKIEVVGNVDSNQLGVYKIYYHSKVGIFRRSRVLTVFVKDTSAPSLSLVGSSDVDVCPERKYQEQGFKAYDNFDGNITEKVKVKKIRDRIIYSVRDAAGNFREVVRHLHYQDQKPPTILLKGDIYENVYVGEKFEDPFVQAFDNCDGDLSKKVIVEGAVDTNVPGEYELKYSVYDQAHNKAEVKRIVRVLERGKNGAVYLTFDDGPRTGTTDVILDILKEENVKATFFVTNSGPDELIVREDQEGHTVALHTASHNYSYIYSSVDNYYSDLYSVRERVKRLTGKDADIIRFPGGSSNTISRKYSEGIMSILTSDVLKRGFRYYDWNLASGDAGEFHTADEVYHYVISHLSKERINVVLMHDIKSYTRDALRRIIQYGKENGYIFDKITSKTEMLTQRVNN